MDFLVGQVEWTKGAVTEYASSETVRRGFCAHCGSTLTYRHTDHADYLTLSITSLDEPTVAPTHHLHCDQQLL